MIRSVAGCAPRTILAEPVRWCAAVGLLVLACQGPPPPGAAAPPSPSPVGQVGATARPADGGDALKPPEAEATASPVPVSLAIPSGADREAARAADHGDFKRRYVTLEDHRFDALEELFRDSQLFEQTLAGVNQTVALPADVDVVLRPCDEANSYYNENKHEIIICYELIASFAQQFPFEKGTAEEKQAARDSIAGATLFIFFHEAGHAVIHLYDLPVTGREEDAADQLASLVLMQAGPEGEKAVLDAANTFLAGEGETALDQMPFWDEHSLDRQRFFSLLCWVFGKSPRQHQDLVADGYLPEERATSCRAEFRQMSRSWQRLLDPYLMTDQYAAATVGLAHTRAASPAAP